MASEIKIKAPLKGKLMQLEYALLVNYAKEILDERNEENSENLKMMTKALNDYPDGYITFNELWNIFKKCGYDGEKLDLISSEGVDYGEIATFEEIRNITDEDVRQYKVGYKFNGNPAHPELFNLYNEDGDKFTGKPEILAGRFIYKCPKIGGQIFQFNYTTEEKDEEDGDFWIELSGSTFSEVNRILGGYNQRFELRIINKEGKRFTLWSNGILLSTLMMLGDEEYKYEMAFANGQIENGEFEELDTKVLSEAEIETFKSYIRAFIEALEGEGKYNADLERLEMQKKDNKSNKGGCFGLLLLPLCIAGGILLAMI